MTFISAGMAVALPDFSYNLGEAQVTAKPGRIPYRAALSQLELDRLELAISAWKRRASFYSLREQKVAVPEYKAILEFGGAAIPVIFADLKREPSYLFLALQEITGDNPVYDGIRGDLNAMVGAWIQWIQSEFDLQH